MEKMVVVVGQGVARTFMGTENGNPKEIKCVEVTLSTGLDLILATAFDAQAQRLIDHPLVPGQICNAEIRLGVRNWKDEKGVEHAAPTIRLGNIVALT